MALKFSLNVRWNIFSEKEKKVAPFSSALYSKKRLPENLKNASKSQVQLLQMRWWDILFWDLGFSGKKTKVWSELKSFNPWTSLAKLFVFSFKSFILCAFVSRVTFFRNWLCFLRIVETWKRRLIFFLQYKLGFIKQPIDVIDYH